MGLFSKTPRPNPRISTQGLEIEFHLEDEWWEFSYRGTDFSSFGESLKLPSIVELDSILNTLESLKPEMKSRLKKELAEWDGAKVDDGETCSVEMTEFAKEKTFAVSWSGGATWGDLGVDFTVKDQAIVDESWGD